MFWYVLVKGDPFRDLNIANLEISFVPNAKDRGCFGTQRNFTINWWSTPLTDSAHAYAPSANIVPVFYKILILLNCSGQQVGCDNPSIKPLRSVVTFNAKGLFFAIMAILQAGFEPKRPHNYKLCTLTWLSYWSVIKRWFIYIRSYTPLLSHANNTRYSTLVLTSRHQFYSLCFQGHTGFTLRSVKWNTILATAH